jgi:ABC-type multidrug transport system fused ATPase/permease subunit
MSPDHASLWVVLGDYIRHLAGSRIRLTALCALSAGGAGLEIAGFGGGAWLLLAENTSQRTRAEVWAYIAAITGALLAAALIRRIVDAGVMHLNCYIEYQQRTALIERVRRSDWAHASRHSQGQWLSAMMSEPTMVSNGIAAFAQLSCAVAALLPLLAVATLQARPALLILSTIGAFGNLATHRIRRSAVTTEAQIQAQSAQIGEQASTLLGSLKGIYASRHFDRWGLAFQTTLRDLRGLRSRQLSIGPRNRLALDVTSAVGVAGLLAWASIDVAGRTTILLVLAVAYRSLPRIQQIQQAVLTVRVQHIWLKRWEDRLASLPPSETPRPSPAANVSRTPKRIDIQHLEVSQIGRPFDVVASGLTISLGDFILMDGPSGSGKTTILDGLLGLLPTRNAILTVDGNLVDTWSRDLLPDLEYVSQSDGFGTGTLRSILLAGETRTDEEIWRALSDSELLPFVESLASSLDTELVSFWSSLSGGQRQRLALARALLSKPRLLVLDEATSALDKTTETQVLHALRRRCSQDGLIVIFVSHNASGIQGWTQRWRCESGLVSGIPAGER